MGDLIIDPTSDFDKQVRRITGRGNGGGPVVPQGIFTPGAAVPAAGPMMKVVKITATPKELARMLQEQLNLNQAFRQGLAAAKRKLNEAAELLKKLDEENRELKAENEKLRAELEGRGRA